MNLRDFIALPTDVEQVRAFEKTLIGGFSCVNTRLAFDTNILLNDTDKEKILVKLDITEKKNKTYFTQNFRNG